MFMHKVSVIIPTYNCGPYIKETLNSVLNQSFSDYEIIVINDGSTDNTDYVLKPYMNRIVYFSQKNKGVSAARNLGIQNAKGEWIAFLDADDIWERSYLQKQINFLSSNPKVDIICRSMFKCKGSFNNIIGIIGTDFDNSKQRIEELILNGNIPSAIVAKRGCFEHERFDETLRGDEDIDLLLRLSQKYNIHYINQPLGKYLKHGTNWTENPIKTLLGHIRICNKFLRISKDIPLKKYVKRKLANTHYSLGLTFYYKGDFLLAFRYFISAIAISPQLLLKLILQGIKKILSKR